MNKPSKTIFSAVIGLSLLGLSVYSFVHADNTASPSFTLSPTPTPSPTLLDRIEQGKALLKSSPQLRFEERRISKKGATELLKKQIALAIYDSNAGRVFEKRVWVKEKDIKNYAKTKTILLESNFKNDPLTIKVTWWNSFNTLYEIPGHPELIIVGNKYLMPTTGIPDPNERSKSKYTEIIYVPYSDQLSQQIVIDAGKAYVNNQVEKAFTDLAAKSVMSRSIPDSIVTNVVSKDFLKNIIVVEHVDPDAFKRSTDKGKILTDRVLTLIGANQDKAYRYTGSPAGASGISQFIKSTYLRLAQQYPSAELIPNYGTGTADHPNSFKAMVLFFDAHKREIENKVQRDDILQQLGGVQEEMLAAAYNGGPTRVIKSVDRYGNQWATGQLQAFLPKIFRNETLGYISKFVAIKGLHLF